MNKDLINENIGILLQAEEIISGINDSQFVFDDSPLFHSSAGMHFRHILDFYSAFRSGYKNREVDYDNRERNDGVAAKRDACISKIGELISFLDSIKDIDLSFNLTVTTIEGITGNSSRAESNIARELQFLLSHSIHHYALISMILKSQGAKIPKHFGIARSTIEFYNY